MILTKIITVFVYICDDCGEQKETDGSIPVDPPPTRDYSHGRSWSSMKGGQHVCPDCAKRRDLP